MRVFTLLIVLMCNAMCTTNTEVYLSTFQRDYDKGRRIEVIREDRFTRWKGMLTGINYGNTTNFSYRFNIQPDNYAWEGLTNQVPVALVLCDNDTYLKVTERIVKYDSLYGPAHFKDTTLFFKNKDDRYFFKLFGDQYFIPTDSIEYSESVLRCTEQGVPYLN